MPNPPSRSNGDQIRLDSAGWRWQHDSTMRLLLAALLVLIGLLFAGGVLPDHFAPPVAGAMLAVVTFFLVVVVFIVLNAGKKVRKDSGAFEERLREMEA